MFGCAQQVKRLLFAMALASMELSAQDELSRIKRGLALLVVDFCDGKPEDCLALGTGAFVDNDGLLITADHVLHQYPADGTISIFSKPVSGKSARRIDIYSFGLTGHKRTMDLTTQASRVRMGRMLGRNWLDVAAIRLDLSEAERSQIQPLDIELDNPSSQQKLYAHGPECSTVDTQCLEKIKRLTFDQPTAIVSGSPITGRDDYKVTNIQRIGFSGGPLTSEGRIVGIASKGVKLNGSGTEVKETYYLPTAQVRRYLSGFMIPSTFLSDLHSCEAVCGFGDRLTAMDVEQMKAPLSRVFSTEAAQRCFCGLVGAYTRLAIPPPATADPAALEQLPCLPGIALASIRKLYESRSTTPRNQVALASIRQLVHTSTARSTSDAWLVEESWAQLLAKESQSASSATDQQALRAESLHHFGQVLGKSKVIDSRSYLTVSSLLANEGETEDSIKALLLADKAGLNKTFFIDSVAYLGSMSSTSEGALTLTGIAAKTYTMRLSGSKPDYDQVKARLGKIEGTAPATLKHDLKYSLQQFEKE